MVTTLGSGIDELDRELGGGYPAGSVVALVFPPTSAGELVAYSFATVDDRHTEYLTTARPEAHVQRSIETATTEAENALGTGGNEFDVTVRELDPAAELLPADLVPETGPFGAASTGPPFGGDVDDGTPFLNALARLKEYHVPNSRTHPALVVDSFSDLLEVNHGSRGAMTRAFRALYETVHDVDGVAYLLFQREPGREYTSLERHVLHAADGALVYGSGASDDADDPDAVGRRGDSDASDVLSVTKLRRLKENASGLPVSIPLRVGKGVRYRRE